jgi:hypothetical protein
MTKLWFKARRYGWGWTPASIEGWMVLAVFLVLVVGGVAIYVRALRGGVPIGRAMPLFLLWIAILSGGLIAIGYATGEPPRWRWGK